MKDSLKQIAENREKVEEMGEAVGFNSDDDIDMLEDALRLKGIDNEVLDEPIDPDNHPHKYSIRDHIISSLKYFLPNRVYPSHAEVVNIEYREDNKELKIVMDPIDYDEEFTESYNYTENPDEDLISIFSMANADINRPSTLIGKEVPITYDGNYTAHIPPQTPGLRKHILYHIVRMGRKHNLFRYSSGRHVPNSKGYLLLIMCLFSLIPVIYTFIPSVLVFTLWFSLAMCVLLFYGIRLDQK